MGIDDLKDKAHSLPLKPGVYIMKNDHHEVIYVGKAKALKNRVSQYFQDAAGHNEKTKAMVSNVATFDVIIVDSEFEALVLECALIKRHQPKYNILLKDDKGYPYIKLMGGEEYPQFSVVTRVAEDGGRYFGPYGSRGSTNAILDALREALKLPACRKKFPRDIGKERPCLNYHMGRCDGHCRAQLGIARHREAMEQAVRLLEGRQDEVVADLTEKMEQAAERLHFEEATTLRDRLRAISLLAQRQKVVAGKLADTDVVGYHRGEAKCCFVVLHFVEGELAAKDAELLELPVDGGESEAVSALLGQYYGDRAQMPRQILLPCQIEDEVPLMRLFSEQCGHRVELVTPQRGAKVELIGMAYANAKDEVERATSREERQSKLMEALGHLLGLATTPSRIESYDISNTGGADVVASMVVFEQGRPKKRDYRHFKIRTLDGRPDDYHSMEEVLTRRFRRHMEGDAAFGAFPDLLLIDGGQTHAAVAQRVLDAAGLTVPIVGMVKDDRHRTRALITPQGREIGLQGIPALFALIGQIQEETHRFAIEFHRLQRKKSVQTSALDDIAGVGPARRSSLLRHFKSVKAIRNATLAELESVVPRDVAGAVYRHFNQKKEGGQ